MHPLRRHLPPPASRRTRTSVSGATERDPVPPVPLSAAQRQLQRSQTQAQRPHSPRALALEPPPLSYSQVAARLLQLALPTPACAPPPRHVSRLFPPFRSSAARPKDRAHQTLAALA